VRLRSGVSDAGDDPSQTGCRATLPLYLQTLWPGDAMEAVARERIVAETQIPARPSDGRVSQQHGDKANGVRQRGHACSGAHCMLGVTRTQGRRAM
jgi:hypothetical protein